MSAEAEREQLHFWAAVKTDPYTSAVLDVLVADFPDLRNPIVADVVRRNVYAHTRSGNRLEVIVDDPISANWRLIAAPHDRRRVHLACWRRNRTDADTERWNRLNAALDAIPAPGAEGSGS